MLEESTYFSAVAVRFSTVSIDRLLEFHRANSLHSLLIRFVIYLCIYYRLFKRKIQKISLVKKCDFSIHLSLR